MQNIAITDFWFSFFLVGIVGGALAQIIGGVILHLIMSWQQPKQTTRDTSVQGTTITFSKQYFRMWLFYIVAFAIILFTTVIWIAFWNPIISISTDANLSPAYKLFIPVFSAIIYLGLANYMLYSLVSAILQYESQFHTNNSLNASKFYNKYAIPLGVICLSVVITEGSIVAFEFIRGGMLISPSALLCIIYASIFAISTIWLILIFLTNQPLLLHAFEPTPPTQST